MTVPPDPAAFFPDGPPMPRPPFALPLLFVGTVLLRPVPAAETTPAEAVGAARDAARERIAADVRTLAGEAFEGRGVETEGIVRAADFLRDRFRELGLKGGMPDGSYFEPFKINLGAEVNDAETTLSLTAPDGETVEPERGTDWQAIYLGAGGGADAPVVFAGYGITAKDKGYDDFAAADGADSPAKGKVVLVLRKEPQQTDPDSAFDGEKTTPHAFLRSKLAAAKKAGAAAVLLVNDPLSVEQAVEQAAAAAAHAGGDPAAAQTNGDTLADPGTFGGTSVDIPFAQITQDLANRMLAAAPLRTAEGGSLSDLKSVVAHIDETFAPLTQPMTAATGGPWRADLTFTYDSKEAQARNVIAVLEGDGPRADETVVVGAHYDHLGFGGVGSRSPGTREIHNGADDNASGTATLLEIARRFAEDDAAGNPPPRRLVFILFSGEERGLLGSAQYVKEPPFPLDSTVAMFNYDMVGRFGTNRFSINGVASAKEFPELIDRLAEEQSIDVQAVAGVLGASDHYNFFLKQIPVFHFFTGLTPEYHTPEDDYETLNLDGMARIADYTEALLRAVVTMPEPPQYVKAPAANIDRGKGTGTMAYLGVVPDYSGVGEGLLITGVNEGSPAIDGGLQADDRILKFGTIDVSDIQGLADGLRSYNAGDEVEIVVKRGDETKTVTVKLGEPRGSR